MFDNKTTPIPKDPLRVDIDDPEEVRYWTERFSCSRGQLIMAVAKVGLFTSAVEQS